MKSNLIQNRTRTFESFIDSDGAVRDRTVAADGYPMYIRHEDDPYAYLKRPKPPTAEMIKRAQPYRADILEQQCVIKDPQHRFNG
mgnify:FL=1